MRVLSLLGCPPLAAAREPARGRARARLVHRASSEVSGASGPAKTMSPLWEPPFEQQELPSVIHDHDMDSRWDWQTAARPGEVVYEDITPEECDGYFGYSSKLDDKYELGPRIGRGAFGTVRLARHREEGLWYAIKAIPKVPRSGVCSRVYLERLRNEVLCMRQLGGSFDTVLLKDVFEDKARLYLVQDACAGGSVLDRMRQQQGGSLPEDEARHIIRGVLRFLHQCHSKGIVYRDVKPANFLFLTRDRWSPVKASDLGLAVRWRPGDKPLRGESGTLVFMAPEVFIKRYGQEVDLWSAGCTLHQMLTGETLFYDEKVKTDKESIIQRIMMEKLDFGEEWQAKHNVSPEAADLLSRLLLRDPEKRATAADALKHPWLSLNATVEEPDTQRSRASEALDGTLLQRMQRFATHSRLMQLVLSLIAQDESIKREGLGLSKLDVSFGDDFAPAALSGMDVKALHVFLSKLGYKLTFGECQQLFSRLDVNEDGALSEMEVRLSLFPWDRVFRSELWEVYVDRAFDILDENRNGTVSIDKVVSVMASMLQRTGAGNSHFDEFGWEHEGEGGERSLVERARDMLREVGSDASGNWRLTRHDFHRALTPVDMVDDLVGYDHRKAIAMPGAGVLATPDAAPMATRDVAPSGDESDSTQEAGPDWPMWSSFDYTGDADYLLTQTNVARGD